MSLLYYALAYRPLQQRTQFPVLNSQIFDEGALFITIIMNIIINLSSKSFFVIFVILEHMALWLDNVILTNNGVKRVQRSIMDKLRGKLKSMHSQDGQLSSLLEWLYGLCCCITCSSSSETCLVKTMYQSWVPVSLLQQKSGCILLDSCDAWAFMSECHQFFTGPKKYPASYSAACRD